METYTGNCLCGGVAFRIVGTLAPIQLCHCRQCRKAQGGAFATNTPVKEEALLFERGRELIHEYWASPRKCRAFCSQCGSPIYSRRDDRPGEFRIRVGLINEPLDVRPAFHSYVASKANWWAIDDDLPQYPDKFPGQIPQPRQAGERNE